MSDPNFDRLLALLPELEARTCGWMQLYEIAHEDAIIVRDFDWPAWMTKGQRYLKPGGVEAADFETCRRLLTVLIRQERFNEGSLRGSIEDGLVARIVRRIAELAPTA